MRLMTLCIVKLEENHPEGGKYTGPLEPGCSTGDIYLDCLWYNSTIKYAKITDVSVEFMDGITVDVPTEYL